MRRIVMICIAACAVGFSGCTGSAADDTRGRLSDTGVQDASSSDVSSPSVDGSDSSFDDDAAGADVDEAEWDAQGDAQSPDAGDEDARAPEDSGSIADTRHPDAAPDPPQPIEDPTHSSTINLADPDTVLARDGRYITYGTTIGAGRGPRCGGRGKLYLPYLEHGSGNSVRISDCAAGDAMPSGPGGWAEPGGAIWAPGVARFKGKYYLFYTATKRGTGQKCIGRAVSNGARGPFVSKGEWACPPRGRWAIDANPFVAGGKLYVAYRDDAINSFPETGLSVVRTDDRGRAIWGTRKDLLKSTDINWETTRMSGTSRVVENPSMFRSGGVWYVAYSANNWDSPRYATGIAKCGNSPLPARRCTPERRGVQRPYFGFKGNGGLGPYRGLPGNHKGPGGMDIFKAADGSLRAVWHWWRPSDRTRHVAVGRLLTNGGGFYVGE